MVSDGVLLYCISNTFDVKLSGIAGMDGCSRLYAIEYKNLYAIVSNVSLEEYGQENIKAKGEDVKWITEKAQIFMNIILSINETSNIIPMKFLTIFNTEERVQEIIEENHEDFTRNFEKLVGSEELSLKIYCNDKVFKDNSMKEEIDKFEKSLMGKAKGAAFFLRKKFDSELNNKVQSKICTLANSMVNGAQEFAIDMKSNKLLAKELTGIDLGMILNCAFLVNSKDKENFIDYIKALQTKYEQEGFLIEYSGPWPPYNFIN